MRKKLKPLKLRYFDEAWNIGFVTNNIEKLLAGETPHYVWMKHDYNDRWFADPFIIHHDDTYIYLLVEEYYLPMRKGRIAQLKVDKCDYKLIESKVVLEEPTHLSFPFTLWHQDKLLMFPENYRSKAFWVYQYNKVTSQFDSYQQVSTDLLADTIITTTFGNTLLFATKFPKPSHETLDIYQYNIETHRYSWQSTVTFAENIARNAGNFFKVKHQIYRPAQECNRFYGHGLSIQKVTKNDKQFTFQEVLRIEPPRQSAILGIHTFNHFEDITVVDGKYFRPSRLSPIILCVTHFLQKLHII